MKATSKFLRCLIGAGVAMLMSSGSFAQKLDDVSVQLDYVVRSDHAMFFVAKEKGFFAENGINVTAIRKGTGSTDALRLVANGNADFGFSDLPTLMVGRVQTLPVVALAAVNQKSPMAMLSVKSRKPISTPADLKGMNIGVHSSGSTYIFLKAFLAANGMSLADIKQSTVAPPYESFLLLGRVDAVPGYINAEVPELEEKAGGPGTLSIVQGSDFGYNAYGSGVFTSEKMIAQKPELVQRFMNAYLKAFDYVAANPKEAVDIIVKLNPEYAPKSGMLTKQLQTNLARSFFSDATKEKGLGYIAAQQWKSTAETLIAQDVLPKTASLTAGYDARFQEAAKPTRR
ncbi:NitT/TauT family transport system substrate-binding protein [Polaromonas sp. OV174]|uniref:ABC transporter substrate-binding protein n=1 Tax=Polaromonas sp. OV174 TaxID=1855300 RepID=UPI0008F206A6|nr:ABC transporter substrate-binding protein [Polaromonas sp. OV174]SFC73766.1 NitT/TauT family transport system substrate-binding protein [Polaromonas sp. OV174]